MFNVFVYGSLKKGFHNHRLLEKSDFLGEFTTSPDFTMYSLGGFPGLVCEGQTRIQGEVYQVNEETFQNLDWLEGYPNFYDRKIIQTDFGDAWVYFLRRSDNSGLTSERIVESGVWK